ncbi:MAG: hypothetical protein D6705_10270 [Deltaproteobacteria bacterium]|nr:MAG: hypothetical protein D6705_10270 [Deltaproteobacteria bacterium]
MSYHGPKYTSLGKKTGSSGLRADRRPRGLGPLAGLRGTMVAVRGTKRPSGLTGPVLVAVVCAVYLACVLEPPEARGGDVREAYLHARATVAGLDLPFLSLDHRTARWALHGPLRAVVSADPNLPALLHVAPALAFVVAGLATYAAGACAGALAGWLAVAALLTFPEAPRIASQPLPDGFVAAAVAVALWRSVRYGERPGAAGAFWIAAALAFAYGARVSSLLFVPPFGWWIARRGGWRHLAVFAAAVAGTVVVDNLACAAILGATRFGLVAGDHGRAMEAFALDGVGAWALRILGWPVPWLTVLFATTVVALGLRRTGRTTTVTLLAFAAAAVYVLGITYALADPAHLVPASRLRLRYLSAAGPCLAVLLGTGGGALLHRMGARRDGPTAHAAGAALALAAVLFARTYGDDHPKGLAALAQTARDNAMVDAMVDDDGAFAGAGKRGLRALEAVRAFYVDTDALVEPNGDVRWRIGEVPQRPGWWLLSTGSSAWLATLRCPVRASLRSRFLVLDTPPPGKLTCFSTKPAAPPSSSKKRRTTKRPAPPRTSVRPDHGPARAGT